MSLDRPLMTASFHSDMRAALGLDSEATLERCSAKCAELRELCMTADDAMMSQGVDLAPRMTGLKALMGLPNHSTLGDILDAVEEMIEAAIERHEAAYHSAGPDSEPGGMSASATDTEGAEGAQTTMSTPTTTASDTNQAIAVQLGEEKARASAVAAERDALATEKAALSLRLKDAEARAGEATTALADRDGQIAALKAQIDRRDAEEQEARVTLAFNTYKDARKLGDDDKAAMRITLKADPVLFAKLYPAVAPAQQHLLADLTGRRTERTTTTTAGSQTGNAVMGAEEMRVLSDKYRREGMSLEDATNRAYREAKAAARAANGVQH